MATSMTRKMVTIPPDLEFALDRLKKEQFYNTSKSEMLRYLIQQGLHALDKPVSRPAAQTDGQATTTV